VPALARLQTAGIGRQTNAGVEPICLAARTLFALAGRDLDELRRQAQSRWFGPVELDVRATGRLVSAVPSFPQCNLAGVLEGTDPNLRDELVIYSAHWDHLGIQDGRIYKGEVDNGSALATLLAVAQASVGHPTRRSHVFLVTCSEEQGLLGALAHVRRPLWPAARTVADLNFESLNWAGPSRGIEFLGGERGDLQELGERTARAMGTVLRPSGPEAQGLYFRSDHFPVAKAGIPALPAGFSLAGQRDYLENPDASRAKARTYLARYHRESDDFGPSWNPRGMVQRGHVAPSPEGGSATRPPGGSGSRPRLSRRGSPPRRPGRAAGDRPWPTRPRRYHTRGRLVRTGRTIPPGTLRGGARFPGLASWPPRGRWKERKR
jgi:Peptidase family M28